MRHQAYDFNDGFMVSFKPKKKNAILPIKTFREDPSPIVREAPQHFETKPQLGGQDKDILKRSRSHYYQKRGENNKEEGRYYSKSDGETLRAKKVEGEPV